MDQQSTPVAPKRQLVVFMLKNDDGEYLLQFRDGNPGIIHPLQWSLFGGHIEPGEDAMETARRELEEELGVCAGPHDLNLVGTFELPGKHYDIVECRYPVNWADITLGEGAGCGFFNDDEIQRIENCSPLIKWLRTRILDKASAAN